MDKNRTDLPTEEINERANDWPLTIDEVIELLQPDEIITLSADIFPAALLGILPPGLRQPPTTPADANNKGELMTEKKETPDQGSCRHNFVAEDYENRANSNLVCSKCGKIEPCDHRADEWIDRQSGLCWCKICGAHTGLAH